MKIDIFTHVQLAKYKQAIYQYADRFATDKKVQDKRPTLTDNEMRIKLIDQYEGYVQVLSGTLPPLEEIMGPEDAPPLARLCNDEMAELMAKHPEKYVAAIANVPLNNIDAALKETDRANRDLAFKGIQIYPFVNGKPASLAVEAMDIPEGEKKKIFEENARELLRL